MENSAQIVEHTQKKDGAFVFHLDSIVQDHAPMVKVCIITSIMLKISFFI